MRKENTALTTKSTDGVHSNHYKDTKHLTQMQIAYLSFYEKPKTMLQVSFETGIERASICRYVSRLRKSDQISVVGYGLCPITHFKAGFYTTNPELFPAEHQQPSLFENEIPAKGYVKTCLTDPPLGRIVRKLHDTLDALEKKEDRP